MRRAQRFCNREPRPETSPAPSRHNEPGSIDRLDYAAYRDLMEESSVEIITALVQEDAADTEAASKNLLAAEKRPGGAETGKVRRFLKALTGD